MKKLVEQVLAENHCARDPRWNRALAVGRERSECQFQEETGFAGSTREITQHEGAYRQAELRKHLVSLGYSSYARKEWINLGTNAQQGIILNVAVGIVGALIGGWLLGAGSINDGITIMSFIVSLIGSVLLLAILSLFQRSFTRSGMSPAA